MIIRRTRTHKVNPKQYESVDMGAVIEIDTDQDELPEGNGSWHDYMDKFLDDALADDVRRAVESTDSRSHLETFYKE